MRVYSLTVEVGEGDGVGDGEDVGVELGVGIGDGDKVGVGVGVGEIVGVGVRVGAGVGGIEITGEGDAVGEIVRTGVGLGTTLTLTPRFHTLLPPFLTQVNSLFLETTTAPTFLHAAPARGVFAETDSMEAVETRSVNPIARIRRISEV